ncbi:MAG: sulfatase, partial [Akkermansiaceae bacterium]|nr:sulfatase [Akkermansiaceae bacterium]
PGIMPNLDALAADGVVFEHAWSPMATTHPSHSTMMTGLYPRYHGVRWNGDKLPEDITTVAQWLQGAGYQTGAFVAYKAMLFRAGLKRGFDAVSDHEKPRGEPAIRPGGDVVQLAANWLKTVDPQQPVFLWVHLFEAHGPYELTDYARARLGAYDGPLAQGHRDDEEGSLRNRDILASAAELGALRILYEGEAHESDRRVGELMELLNQNGLLQDAVVVATGDHGQSLGENDFIGHGPRLDESIMRVPLLMKDFRGSEFEFAEIRVAAPVGLVDIAPTLADLAGNPVPEGLQGRSLAKALDGEEPAPGIYFGEVTLKTGRGEKRVEHANENEVAVYLWPYKLTRDEQGDRVWELEDLELTEKLVEDPGRFHEVRDRLTPHMEAFLANRWDKSSAAELDEDDLEELRSLGYLQ